MSAIPEVLQLNWREVMLLEDRIKEHRDPDDGIFVKPLLIRIASVYLELMAVPPQTPSDAVCQVAISEPETWFLRRMVKSADAIQQVNVGIGLLRKLYTILLAFQDDDVTEGFSEAASGVPAHSLQEWKDAEHARHHDDPDTNHDAGPNTGG